MKKFILLIVLFSGLGFLNAQSDWHERLADMQEEIQDKIQAKIEKTQAGISGWSDKEQAQFREEMEKMQMDLAEEMKNIKVDLSDEFLQKGIMIAAVAKGKKDQDRNIVLDIEVHNIKQFDDDLFDKLADIKGVEVVYISKSLLGMMPKMNMSGVNIGSVASKLTGLQIFTAEKGGAFKTLKSESGKLVKKGKYETVMFVKDDDSKTVFYLRKLDDKESELLMITEEPSEISVIRLMGSFTIKDIQGLTKDQKKYPDK